MGSEVSSGRIKEFLAGMPSILDAIGQDDFYVRTSSEVARFVGSNRYLVIRYAKYSKPNFFVNFAMTDDAISSYMSEYYRIDPLLRMARQGATEEVVTFDELRKKAQDTLFYDEMYRTAQIRDELVFLLAAIGGATIAICIDRDDRNFTLGEMQQARSIFPILKRLHSLHLHQSLRAPGGDRFNQVDVAMMILDVNNNVLFRSDTWLRAATLQNEDEFFSLISGAEQGALRLQKNRVLHWERLREFNGIAPQGTIVFLEEVSPGYINLSDTDWKSSFTSVHRLTPREIDIISLMMNGEPTLRIAQELGISSGTVRNHRHRLYMKLDITTERELFSMLFNELTRNLSETGSKGFSGEGS